MRKIYAASWKLFSLTAEADRVLCQLMTFLTVFFHWMYKMKYSSYQEPSVIHGWFVYWVFGWEMRGLSKFGNPISGWYRFQNRVYSLAFAWGVRGLKSLKQFWPHLMAFGSSISTSKPEQLWSWLCFFFVVVVLFSGFVKTSVVYARDNDPLT